MSDSPLAIGFDLDGTLWDSLEPVTWAWREGVRRFPDVTPPSDAMIKSVMGLPPRGIARGLFPGESEERAMEIFRVCTELEIEHVAHVGGRLFPGLEDTLAELSSRHPLYIVSNCQKGYIEAFLSFHRLGKYFTDHENAENTGLSKGGNIMLVMKRNGFSRSVYIGDTEGDRQAALEAGVPFVFAAYGFGSVSGAGMRIDSVEELKRLF